MNTKRPSTSSDPDIVRAAGEGMVNRHSEEGDKRAAREREADEKTKDSAKK